MKIVFFLVLVVAVIVLAVPINAVVSISETIGNYRISFDAGDNTNMIAKFWNNSGGGILETINQ